MMVFNPFIPRNAVLLCKSTQKEFHETGCHLGNMIIIATYKIPAKHVDKK